MLGPTQRALLTHQSQGTRKSLQRLEGECRVNTYWKEYGTTQNYSIMLLFSIGENDLPTGKGIIKRSLERMKPERKEPCSFT
jgi:hypothetical protein